MSLETRVKGYKGFDKDFKCRGFQYAVGETYTFDGEIEICKKGFHYCPVAIDCLDYYPLYLYDNKNFTTSRYAEVEALGEIIEQEDKCTTSKIRIIREIPREEWLQLCTGEFKYYNDNTPTNNPTGKKAKIYRLLNYKNGLLDGLWEDWDILDQHRKGYYIIGKKEGLWQAWYNSKPPLLSRFKGTYVNNLREGLWEYWSKDGYKEYQETYKEGKLISFA